MNKVNELKIMNLDSINCIVVKRITLYVINYDDDNAQNNVFIMIICMLLIVQNSIPRRSYEIQNYKIV